MLLVVSSQPRLGTDVVACSESTFFLICCKNVPLIDGQLLIEVTTLTREGMGHFS